MKKVRQEERRGGKQPGGGTVCNTNASAALPSLIFPKGLMYFSSKHNLVLLFGFFVCLFPLQNADSSTDTCSLHESGGHFLTLGHGQIAVTRRDPESSNGQGYCCQGASE